ncbi:hypothetical protein ACH5RR_005744 [Cinchona calisaya]|uniref:RRM domain-containing protein n=1 Tax=Cinchona calisaya TaxID=153742 RepID=A0ABD3AM16_9GENT
MKTPSPTELIVSAVEPSKIFEVLTTSASHSLSFLFCNFKSPLQLSAHLLRILSQTAIRENISCTNSLETMQMTRTVKVKQLSDLASEREIHEFFSFSGEIQHVEILRQPPPLSRTAFITFKDPKALEIALLLSGATIVDQIVTITPAENYVPQYDTREVRIVGYAADMYQENTSLDAEVKNSSPSGRVYVNRAQDVVSSVFAKGSAIGQDAINKARAFDEKHSLRANASARVASFNKRVGLTEKLTVGISVVNEKFKSVDQRLQVSDKTMAAMMAAERKLNNTGSAVKSSRYVTVGTSWLNGVFSKVTKAGQVAGTKTREKWNIALSNLTAKDPSIVA